MSYVEKKKRNVRTLRAQIKKTIRELKDAIAEGADTREMEEELLRLAKTKSEMSQRVRFRLS